MRTYQWHDLVNDGSIADEFVTADVARKLRDALNDAQALALCWASHYQYLHNLEDFHPEHRRILNDINEAIAAADGEPT